MLVREYYIPVREDDRYEVSNLGNVRNRKTGRVLRPRPNYKNGYGRVKLGDRDYYVHRLVAGNFFAAEDDINTLDVNHIDGDHTNNCINNLEWCTRKENIRHSIDKGLNTHKKVRIVRCRFCKHRNSEEFCFDRPDDFFCAYGEMF